MDFKAKAVYQHLLNKGNFQKASIDWGYHTGLLILMNDEANFFINRVLFWFERKV